MTQKKNSKRRTNIQDIDIQTRELGVDELKKVRGGITPNMAPTAAQNQKIQEFNSNLQQSIKKQ